MRKQNSTWKAAFLSEAGSGLKNNDYFAFVELERYACYVIADGLNDLPAESARLATETVIMEFQEHPSMKKRDVLSYIRAANQALYEADSREWLKASVTVVVTDYEKLRYAYAGNTRLRIYRNGNVKFRTQDMSLGDTIGREENLSEDAVAKHEERNNLYSYVGKGRGFTAAVSKKIRMEDGDIIALYTRGIWENLDSGELDDVFSEAGDDPKESLDDLEDLLLSRQPGCLENYTFAAIFVDKVFRDPERKKRIKKIIKIVIIVCVILLVICIVIWIFYRMRKEKINHMEQSFSNVVEYIQDCNFVRAEEECREALKYAEKLKDEESRERISAYLRLTEAVNAADEAYGAANYEDAQTGYEAALERSRYADHAADGYIDARLNKIADYLSVSDYLRLGDAFSEQGDYERAEKKYLEARSLATEIHFDAGRQEAMDALETLYLLWNEELEAGNAQAQERAAEEVSAAQLAAEGDSAFSEGDYNGAIAYYTMALEKYMALEDTVHAVLIQDKIDSSSAKIEEIAEKTEQAQMYVNVGRVMEEVENFQEASLQYLLARNIYTELGMEEKISEMNGLLDILAVKMEQKNSSMQENSAPENLPESFEQEDGIMDVSGQEGSAQESGGQGGG